MKKKLRFSSFTWGEISGCLLSLMLALLLLKVPVFTQAWEDFVLAAHFFGQGELHYQEPVVVRIDEASLRALGPWPWPRSYYADALWQLDQEAPAVIGLDLYFQTPDPENDPILAAALTEVATPVVLGTELVLEERTKFWTRRWQERGEIPSLFPTADQGYLNLLRDRDGLIRKWPLLPNSARPAFAERIYQAANGKKALTINNGVMSFAGKLEAFPTLSFAQLLAGDYPQDFFRGKVVLIGVTVSNMDRHGVALSALGSVPGVYLHAYLYRNLVEASWLKPLPFSCLLPLLLGSTLGWLFLWRNRVGSLLLFATVGTSLLIIIIGLAAGLSGCLLPVPSMVGGLVGTSLFLLAASYRTELAERRKLKALFARYVSPEILDEILRRRDVINISGERRFVAVLFADVRGFTRYTEEHEPEQVLSQINQVLGEMTAIILRHGGLVNKFLGDGLMAVFGIPVWKEEIWTEVFAACRAIVTNKNQPTGDALAVGIGLSWGTVLAGSVGNQQRMEYTFFGTPVNLAARLEKMARPGEILFPLEANRTYPLPTESYTCEEVYIKGLPEPLLVGRIKEWG